MRSSIVSDVEGEEEEEAGGILPPPGRRGEEAEEKVRSAFREILCLPVMGSLPRYLTFILWPRINPNSLG